MFKNLFSNFANDLVQKLPAAANKFGNKSIKDYYNDMFTLYPKKLTFLTIQTRCSSDLLKAVTQKKLPESITYLIDFQKMVQIY